MSPDKPVIVALRRHVRFSVAARRHSETRVHGYHTVTRPVLEPDPPKACAECLQRGLLGLPAL